MMRIGMCSHTQIMEDGKLSFCSIQLTSPGNTGFIVEDIVRNSVHLRTVPEQFLTFSYRFSESFGGEQFQDFYLIIHVVDQFKHYQYISILTAIC